MIKPPKTTMKEKANVVNIGPVAVDPDHQVMNQSGDKCVLLYINYFRAKVTAPNYWTLLNPWLPQRKLIVFHAVQICSHCMPKEATKKFVEFQQKPTFQWKLWPEQALKWWWCINNPQRPTFWKTWLWCMFILKYLSYDSSSIIHIFSKAQKSQGRRSKRVDRCR